MIFTKPNYPPMNKNNNQRAELPEVERRFVVHPVRSMRAEGDESKFAVIEGIAAMVNNITTIGSYDPWEEVIAPGAFDDVLADDVRCLFNHDPNHILARCVEGKGTLELFLTPEGHLAYRYTTPDRTFARDLQDAIAAGDVNQSSFSFQIKEQSWIWGNPETKTPDRRTIVKLSKLFDVSPVTFPAYPDTTVGKRSREEARQADPSRHDAAKNEIELMEKSLKLKSKL